MRRTYLDTGVLIEAAGGRGRKTEVALALLNDPGRVFLSCPYLDLELLPRVIQNKNHLQANGAIDTLLASVSDPISY